MDNRPHPGLWPATRPRRSQSARLSAVAVAALALVACSGKPSKVSADRPRSLVEVTSTPTTAPAAQPAPATSVAATSAEPLSLGAPLTSGTTYRATTIRPRVVLTIAGEGWQEPQPELPDSMG